MVETKRYQQSRGGRGKLPAWAANKPQTRSSDGFYLRAYSRLSSERRPFPGQIGPIPWSAIDRYGKRYGLGALLHEWFVDLMLVLDHAYIEDATDEMEREAKQAERAAGKAAKANQPPGFLGHQRSAVRASREPRW